MSSINDSGVSNYLSYFYSVLNEDVNERKRIQDVKFIDKSLLGITDVDLNVIPNSIAHHTDKYEMCNSPPYKLVIRRGQAFTIKLVCNRNYDPYSDIIMLEFNFGAEPKHEKRTRQMLRVQNETKKTGWRWGAKVANARRNEITIEVHTSGTSLVGEWRWKVHTGIDSIIDVKTTMVYEHPDFVFILFNPWCQDDPVFMPGEADKAEYVLADAGTLWQGAKDHQYTPLHWTFGQFEDVVLSGALIVLREELSGLKDEDRGDCVRTTRAMTHLVNDYILGGRWSPPYDDGTEPWAWTGSVEIMEEFMANRLRMVKYGQCWVFSGLLCSLLRSLGIPTRSITNLSSAHDTDRTLTVDEIHVKDPVTGRFVSSTNPDSIWNFHCWDESWMTRADLPPGYDGWQACDSTAQEQSEGKYQCGPMSVAAIKAGDARQNYDGWFVYGEVNADIVRWFYVTDVGYPDNRKLLHAEQDTEGVGRTILTSKRGKSDEAEIITENYKPKEGTKSERSQFRRAIREEVAKDRKDILDLYEVEPGDPDVYDVQFHLTDLEQVKFGDTVESSLEIVNGSKYPRKIDLQNTMYVMRYNGVPEARIVAVEDQVVIEPFKKKTLYMTAAGESYIGKMGHNNTMCVEVVAHIPETNQWYSQRDTFLVEKPTIELEAERNIVNGIPSTLTVFFRNPVNMILTECSLKMEGCGITRAVKVPIQSDIPGCGNIKVPYTFIPRRPGRRTIIALFNSQELSNIRGKVDIMVKANESPKKN